MSLELNEILKIALKGGASDIHMKSGLPPIFRIDGALVPLKNAERLLPDYLEKIAASIMNSVQKERFATNRECDLAYGIAGLGRFRVNVFQQRGTVGIVFRVIPFGVKTIDQLVLPKIVESIANEQRGLILVTGTTGSGKSTSLAAMIEHINSARTCHIMTIEDPIEFLIRDRRSIVNQREIGVDTQTFAAALRAALRQDPDVILIGEMRDAETAQIGLRAAMTGHLVFSTLHTRDAAGTLFRLVDMGTPRFMVASSVQAVVAQRLLRRVCESCSEAHIPTPQESEWLKLEGISSDQWSGLLHGRGCSHCNGTGYRGRMGVYEMLEMGFEMVEAAAHDSTTHFMELAQQHMRGKTLLDHALEEMKLGHTSVSEVMRISNRVEE